MASASDVVFYRPSLDARSGAGQLLALQHRALQRAGWNVTLACERGALRFWWRTRVLARRRSLADVSRLQEQGATIVDHGLVLPRADVVFVHNVASELERFLPRSAQRAAIAREREFFGALDPAATVVANSRLVAAALQRHFALDADRVAVLRPGYSSRRFTTERRAALRPQTRAALGLAAHTPLVGLVTSGDFAKRGLDTFLDCAARIATQRPDARFLVVGSKRLPDAARTHPLVRSGAVHYRPKGAEPERWLAALDVFVYPALFEEYGLVVAEAQALGVPVLTSRRVGASESLPSAYDAWLAEEPDVLRWSDQALALIGDAALRATLAAAALASVAECNDRAYEAGTLQLVEAQKRRLK